MRVSFLLLAAVGCSGCFVQGGARTGALLDHHDAAATWGGQIGAGYEDGVHAGVELEGRAVHGYGSAFGSGLQLGYTTGTDLSRLRLGAHGDTGLSFGFHKDTSFYVGGTLELPLRLSSPSPVAERNRNFRFLGGTPWLVPFLRYRFYRVGADSPGAPRLSQHDLSAGVLLRMSYSTDLL